MCRGCKRQNVISGGVSIKIIVADLVRKQMNLYASRRHRRRACVRMAAELSERVHYIINEVDE